MKGNLSDFTTKVVEKSKMVLENYTPEIEKALEYTKVVNKVEKNKELEYEK